MVSSSAESPPTLKYTEQQKYSFLNVSLRKGSKKRGNMGFLITGFVILIKTKQYLFTGMCRNSIYLQERTLTAVPASSRVKETSTKGSGGRGPFSKTTHTHRASIVLERKPLLRVDPQHSCKREQPDTHTHTPTAKYKPSTTINLHILFNILCMAAYTTKITLNCCL